MMFSGDLYVKQQEQTLNGWEKKTKSTVSKLLHFTYEQS